MSEWISIKTKKPEPECSFVLVSRSYKSGCPAVMEAYYDDGKFIIHRFGMMSEFIEPTHWMPLPNPQKE